LTNLNQNQAWMTFCRITEGHGGIWIVPNYVEAIDYGQCCYILRGPIHSTNSRRHKALFLLSLQILVRSIPLTFNSHWPHLNW